MFLDLPGAGPRRPDPPKPRITPRGEKVLVWIVALNVVLLLVAPIGGATVIQALISLLR
ncbi:hypothetical protein [Roseomonas indoligenes]|uniref:Uncharacterized protein n=1 Tax=Roseomonas indoligenes TaxID=2820811 RepID=A0A940MYD2_9PROT|nr:hypothetical protein [Pararoseomonas indoligenes]MBP0493457.1 hypothetical protein [Pararoseomonas indoligenes]